MRKSSGASEISLISTRKPGEDMGCGKGHIPVPAGGQRFLWLVIRGWRVGGYVPSQGLVFRLSGSWGW